MTKKSKEILDQAKQIHPIQAQEDYNGNSPYYNPFANEVFINRQQRKEEALKRKAEDYKHDHEPIRGRFIYHERPGQTLYFPFRKYREDQTMHVKLEHNELYTLPRMIVRHLNNICRKIYKTQETELGKPFSKPLEIRRFSFEPLDFDTDPTLRPRGSGELYT